MTRSALNKDGAALQARADALLEIGRYSDAVLLLQSGLNQTPHNSPLLCRLAFAFHKLKEPAQAIQYANAAIAADPSEEWGHRLRSVILLEEGQTLGAVQSAEAAVQCNPKGEQSFHALVNALLGAKNKDRAAEVAAHLCSIAPDSIWSHNASALAAMHLHQWEKVVSHCLASIATDPEVYSSWNNMGMAQIRLGLCFEAEASFRQAARLMPTDQLIHYRISVTRAMVPLARLLSAARLKLVFDGKDVKSARLRRKTPAD